MASGDSLVPANVEESEEELQQDLSRTLDSCTRAEAERALQDAFLEEQRRGSSPTAAAAEALRRCRTSSRESGARSHEALDAVLPAAPTPTLAASGMDPLDFLGTPMVQQQVEIENALTEELLGNELVTEDFFSASRRLLFSEQGTASLSST